MEYKNPLIPQMPSFQQTMGGMATHIEPNTGYDQIVTALKKMGGLPQMTQTALPAIQQLLAPGGQKASAYEQAIAGQTSANVAAAQSDAMKRGLSASSIEAAAMGGARAQGQQALSQFYSGTANQLSQHIYNAFQGDREQQERALMALAQAMGQELTSRRDMLMFKTQLHNSLKQTSLNRLNAMIGSMIGAGGSMMGGALAGGMFSDIRLKENVVVHATANGLEIVSWRWNDEAESLGLKGEDTGVIAQQVEKLYPHAVLESKHGWKAVNYNLLPAEVLKAVKKIGGSDDA